MALILEFDPNRQRANRQTEEAAPPTPSEAREPSARTAAAYHEAVNAHIDHIGRIERAYRRGTTQGRAAVIRTINDWFLAGQDQALEDERSAVANGGA